MGEFRRIFGRLSLWLMVAAAVCCNVFLFWQTQEKTYGTVAQLLGTTSQGVIEEYERQLELYNAYPHAQAYEICLEDIAAADEAGLWGKEVYIRKNYVQSLLQHMKEYPEYLNQVQENAKQMQKFSIFMTDGAFSKKNIVVTAEDFARVMGTEVEIGNYHGAKAIFEYRVADYLIILLMLVVCWQMLEERKKGLWSIVRLASGGRLKLAFKRAGIFFFAVIVFSALMYGSMLVTEYLYFGGMDLSVSAQSMPELMKLPIVMTLGEFLGQYLIAKIAGTMLLVLAVWIILSAVANTSVAVAIAGIALTVEYVLFAFLPVQSLFNLLKYCNLFSYFYTDRLYTNYLNMNFLGYPVNAREMLLSLLPILVLAGYVAVIIINSLKRMEGRKGILLRMYEWMKRRTDRIVCGLHGFGLECYKILFVQKGILFLVLLIWLMGQMFPVWGGQVNIGKNALEFRQEEWEGPAYDAEIRRMMQEEKAYIDGKFADFERKQEDFAAGLITETELSNASLLLEAVATRNNVYEQIQSSIQMQESAGVEPWIMNDAWLEYLMTREEGVQRQLGLIALLMLTVLLPSLYVYEEQTGAKAIIRGSGKGRGRFVKRKQWVTFLFVFLVWGAIYGMHAWSVLRFHGIHGLQAPIQAAEEFRGSDWRITVGQFLFLIYGLRLLTLWVTAQVILLFSAHTKKVQGAVLLGVFVLLLPAALWTIGIDVLEPVSMAYPLSGVELFRRAMYRGWSGIVVYLLLTVVGVGCCIWTSRRWIRT